MYVHNLMKLNEYSAGTYRRETAGYRSFHPTTINHGWQWEDPEITDLLSRADRRLGELNGLSLIVPDLDRFYPDACGERGSDIQSY